MEDAQHYQELINRLTQLGYEVLPNPPGYMVRHQLDHNDISHAYSLADLEELTELYEWREMYDIQRRQGK